MTSDFNDFKFHDIIDCTYFRMISVNFIWFESFSYDFNVISRDFKLSSWRCEIDYILLIWISEYSLIGSEKSLIESAISIQLRISEYSLFVSTEINFTDSSSEHSLIRTVSVHWFKQRIFTVFISGNFTNWNSPHSTEYCRNMSEIFPIFHCNWNIAATFLSITPKYFIATLQF